MMFGLSKEIGRLEHRTNRLDECCAKFGRVLEEQARGNIESSESIKHLVERMNDYHAAFKAHDEKEMEKYESIQRELSRINKVIWLAAGIGMALHFIGMENVARSIHAIGAG